MYCWNFHLVKENLVFESSLWTWAFRFRFTIELLLCLLFMHSYGLADLFKIYRVFNNFNFVLKCKLFHFQGLFLVKYIYNTIFDKWCILFAFWNSRLVKAKSPDVNFVMHCLTLSTRVGRYKKLYVFEFVLSLVLLAR
jgi:hypothetical protein